jgi:hypothetical protein
LTGAVVKDLFESRRDEVGDVGVLGLAKAHGREIERKEKKDEERFVGHISLLDSGLSAAGPPCRVDCYFAADEESRKWLDRRRGFPE